MLYINLRRLQSNSLEEVNLSSSLKKKQSHKVIDPPALSSNKRTKSGSKMIEDSIRLNKRNYSMRNDTSSKKFSNTNNDDSDISKKNSQINSSTLTDQYKNYKGGKLSQEFYYKTLNLATNTLGRKDLNASINLKQKILGDRGGGGSISSSKDKETLKNIPSLQSNTDKNSHLVLHKRSNTFNDVFQKRPDSRKGNLNDGSTTFKTSQIMNNPLSKPLTQTQPIHPQRPDSSSSNNHNTRTKPPLSSTTNPTLKDQRSSSFYNDKNRQDVHSNIEQPKNHSAEPKKSKKQESSTINRRTNTQKVYRHIESIKKMEVQLPPFDGPKTVVKDFDRISAFSVNTHQGTVRAYNEDRVSILLNAQQRYENLVNSQVRSCSMFAIYDGHGGSECCNFLKDNLHAYILNSYNERDLRGSIKSSCLRLDTDFFKKARSENHCDTSGSCALVLFVIGISI